MTAAITAYEGDTLSIQVSFYDMDQTTAVTPNSGLTWTLTDGYGTVMNSRTAVSLSSATSVWIELTGNDLIVGSSGKDRLILVSGTYDSVTHGNGRHIRREIPFTIIDAVNVS